MFNHGVGILSCIYPDTIYIYYLMKICLMSGAVINAGDFLIENRAHALINHFIPGSEVTILNRVTED